MYMSRTWNSAWRRYNLVRFAVKPCMQAYWLVLKLCIMERVCCIVYLQRGTGMCWKSYLAPVPHNTITIRYIDVSTVEIPIIIIVSLFCNASVDKKRSFTKTWPRFWPESGGEWEVNWVPKYLQWDHWKVSKFICINAVIICLFAHCSLLKFIVSNFIFGSFRNHGCSGSGYVL